MHLKTDKVDLKKKPPWKKIFCIFFQSTHQVGMKYGVECYKDFFGYFNALKTNCEFQGQFFRTIYVEILLEWLKYSMICRFQVIRDWIMGIVSFTTTHVKSKWPIFEQCLDNLADNLVDNFWVTLDNFEGNIKDIICRQFT